MLFLSLNIGILAVFYTVLGGVLSYVMHHLFDEFEETNEKTSNSYKFFVAFG
jgi:hypothetical protein